MHTVVVGLIALLAYVAAGVKLGAVRRQPGVRAPRALFLTLFSLALGWTFWIKPVSQVVGRLSGIPLMDHLLADTFALCTGCGTQAMLVYLTHNEQAGRRLMRPRLGALAVAVTAMAVAMFAAQPARLTGVLSVDYGTSDFYLAYSAPYLTYLTYIFVGITGLCWRSAKQAGGVPFLAAGLRLIAAGGSTGLVYVALRVGYICVARSTDSTALGAGYSNLSALVVALVTVLVIAGATLPAWAPRVAVYRDVRQLFPLWKAMMRRFPDLAVGAAPSLITDAMPVGDVPRRRNRRVIEIRDARLELRGHFRPRVTAQARELATGAGLQGEELAATVEAARIAVALSEQPPHAHGEEPDRTPADASASGGVDLGSEVSWLRKVSRAFTGSPVVADVVAQESALRGEPGPDRRTSQKLARIITEVTAPAPMLVALLLVVGAASGRTVMSGIAWGLLAAVFFSIAPFAGIVWGVVQGRISDHHVTRRAQRPFVIVLSIASFITGFVVMQLGGAPHQLLAVMGALLAAAIVCLLVTLVWKMSMHMAVAGCAVAVLPFVLGPITLLAWPALAGVAWSRVRLRDHTPAQTIAGAAAGALVASSVFAVLR